MLFYYQFQIFLTLFLKRNTMHPIVYVGSKSSNSDTREYLCSIYYIVFLSGMWESNPVSDLEGQRFMIFIAIKLHPAFGANDGVRFRNPQIGNLVLYQLSYTRI